MGEACLPRALKWYRLGIAGRFKKSTRVEP
jgi:hypothetical protein